MNAKQFVVSVPEYIEKLSTEEEPIARARLRAFIKQRSTPSVIEGYGLDWAIEWPRPPLNAVLVPGGSDLFEEEGYGFDTAIDEFCSRTGNEACTVIPMGFESLGVFRGKYGPELRLWIRRDLIVTPVAILFESGTVFLPNDSGHFSVLGIQSSDIDTLYTCFGGVELMKDTFVEWSDSGFIGFDKKGKEWAYKYLLAEADW